MSDLSLTELRLIAKKRNIKRYKGFSKDELLKNLNILKIDPSNLSLTELKLIAKIRRPKNYKNMSKNELLDTLKKSEPFKGIKEIRKENCDENKRIRDLRALYEPEEDYYKPQKVKGAFDDDYIGYESNGDKGKILSIEEYLNMIIPYLRNIIDDHKDGWKIQLAMEISFVSIVKDSKEDSNEDSNKDSNKDSNNDSNKDSNEHCTIHIYSENSFVFIGYKTQYH